MTQRAHSKHSAPGAPLVLALLWMCCVPLRALPQADATAPPAPPVATGAAAGAPTAEPYPLTREGMTRLLADFDAALSDLYRDVERWRHARDLPRDGRKVDGGDDMLRHALPEELHARLLRARTDVQRDFDAGDWPSVRIGMSDAAADLNAATLRAAAIATYWKEWFLAQRRIAGWERAVRANKLSDPHAGALHEVQDAIAAQVRELRFAETSAGFRRLNELLAVALEEARRSVPGGVLKFDPVRRWPDTPCSAPPGAGEWSATNAAADERGPRINAGDSAPTGRFYPRLAAAFGIEGITSVKARVRSNGCVEWAEVAKTSGFPMLDEAALDWTIDGAKFEPARRGAAPLDGSYTFNMRFYLD